MDRIIFCKRCGVYLLDHENFELRYKGWKYCPSCGWACNKEGYNLIDTKYKITEEYKYEKEIQQKSSESNSSKNGENERGENTP